MKVAIYGDVRKTPRSHKLWEGNLSALPRPEDFISFTDGYSAATVRSVTIIANTDEAEIRVWMNSDDEYPAIK